MSPLERRRLAPPTQPTARLVDPRRRLGKEDRMTASHLSRLIAGAAALALVASFLAPFPAQAEESPPPAEPTAEATLPPDAVAPEAEATPAATESLPSDSPAPEAEALAAEPDLAELTEVEPDLAQLIEAAPEGTTLAAVGADGALLPLVSEAAAEVVAGADPIWCPASVAAPTPEANGCSASYALLGDLISWLSNDVNEPAMDGVIWLMQGLITGGPGFTFNGAGNFAIMADYKLTLRGGWDGNPGSKVISGYSETHAMLQITNWRNDVSLSDLWITSAPAGDDLYVQTTGNITLTRVQSNDNAGRGARLDNTSATTAKSVTISDSQFNENAGSGGLFVQSKGPITLTNVTAGWLELDGLSFVSRGNTGYGAMLDNDEADAVGGVTLLGVNTFSENGGNGLSIDSRGAITISNLTASDNGSGGAGTGATLRNANSPSYAGVTLSGTNLFCNNATSGLVATSLGAIKANALIAHSNGNGYGATLYNRDAPTPQPVTLTGSSSFKYNSIYGLYVRSAGAVTLNNLTASSNGNNGVRIINNWGDSYSPVTLTGSSAFDDNTYDGLFVQSFGAIKAANLSASGNGLAGPSGYGLYLDNHSSPASLPPGVTLTGRATASGNRDGGVYIWSAGAVSLQNATASDNLGIGLWIDNDANPDSPQKVILSGTNVFLGNSGYGLNLYSFGPVTLNAVTASGNGAASGASGAYIYNPGSATPQKVTLTGANVFRDNDASGLTVTGNGAIAVSNLTASGNGSTGVSLDNTAATAPQPITLSGKSTFTANGAEGLYVHSRGAITLASISASDNIGGGANVANNLDPASPQKVAISGVNAFNANGSGGLAVYSYGAITLSGATAAGNGTIAGGSGAHLDNSGSNAPQAITLSGSFTFDDNDGFGLSLASKGAIKAANLTASDNQSTGAVLSNSGPGAVGGITLSGTNRFNNNGTDGLSILSLGAITLSSVTASGNGTGAAGLGAWIRNNAASTPQKVTLSGTNGFNDNVQSGLLIESLGAIAASNLSASRNGAGGFAHGAVLDNGGASAIGGVTLSGASTFDENGHDGLQVSSRGVISLNTTRLQANGNGWDGWGTGVNLRNINAATLLGVTLKGVNNLHDNDDHGLYVWTRGAISLSSLSASGNGSHGAYLDNASDPASIGAITLSGTHAFQDNTADGLYAISRGAITISNLTASGNSGQGASLNNLGAPLLAVQPVKFTGYATLLDNAGAGLGVSSLGAISAANLNASGNGSIGASLSNSTAGAVGAITLSGTNRFSDNASTGLNLSSLGAITVNNLTASANGTGGAGLGAYVNNSSALTPQAVKFTGYAIFNDNPNDGLELYSAGAISAANLTARGNGGNGARLDNSAGLAGVTLSGTNAFSGNLGSGLRLNSDGAVSLTRVTADGNGLNGVHVDWASSLTLTCGYLVSNGGWGLYVSSPADPLLIGVFASGNPSGDLIWNGIPITSDVRACP